MKKPLLILALGLAANFLMKVWKINEPIETDLMVYCMGGHALFHGKTLYKDILDQKPPLLHLIYGIFEKLFGYGEGQIFAVNIFFSSLIILFAYLILLELKIPETTIILLLIFLIFGLLSCLEIEANQPNSELIVNGLLGIALLQSVKVCLRKKNNPWAFCTASAALTFVKHHAIIPAICLAMSNDQASKTLGKKSAFTLPLIILTACLWLSFFLYYYIQGNFLDMWMSLFAMNLTYNTAWTHTLTEAFSWQNIILVSCVCAPQIYFLRNSFAEKREIKQLSLLSLAFTAGSFVMLALPGKWWPHYYQLMIWPSFFSFSLAFSQFWKNAPGGLGNLKIGIIFSALVLSSMNLLNYTRLSPEEISIKKYKGPWFIETKKVAMQIKGLFQGDEWFFVWGQDPGLYVYTKIWPQTRMNTYFPFVFGGIQEYAYRKFFEEVSKHPPEMVIFPRPQIGMIAPNISDPILQWICANYFPISSGSNYEGYLILLKLGGSIDQRIPQEIPRRTLKEIFIQSK